MFPVRHDKKAAPAIDLEPPHRPPGDKGGPRDGSGTIAKTAPVIRTGRGHSLQAPGGGLFLFILASVGGGRSASTLRTTGQSSTRPVRRQNAQRQPAGYTLPADGLPIR